MKTGILRPVSLPSTLGEIYSLTCAVIWGCVILFRKSGETIAPVALNLFKNTVALLLFLVTLRSSA